MTPVPLDVIGYPLLALYRLAGTNAFVPYCRDHGSRAVRADDTNGWSRYAIRSTWIATRDLLTRTNSAVQYRVTDQAGTYSGAGTAVEKFAPAPMGGNLLPMIGNLPPGTGGEAANLELSEFLLYNRTLSDAERAKVEKYLKNKYFAGGM